MKTYIFNLTRRHEKSIDRKNSEKRVDTTPSASTLPLTICVGWWCIDDVVGSIVICSGTTDVCTVSAYTRRHQTYRDGTEANSTGTTAIRKPCGDVFRRDPTGF